jgi:hypothetical protein
MVDVLRFVQNDKPRMLAARAPRRKDFFGNTVSA